MVAVTRMFAARVMGPPFLQWGMRRGLTVSASTDVAPVRACVAAMLAQQRALLTALDDAQYTFHSPLLDGTVGGHTRHALDHLRKPLEAWRARESTIRYDVRARQTAVERDRHAALAQLDEIHANLLALDSPAALHARVDAAFMLSSDGQEVAFASTLSRELAFAVHHAIHHNALVKVLLRHHFPNVHVPPEYGLAPSTHNFQLLHPEQA